MEYYMAPLEGVTGWLFRSTFRKHFTGADKYFTPFISPNQRITGKVRADISPENNAGSILIPQIMAANAAEVLSVSGQLSEYGYEEININLGCPSGTVVTKSRGSGMLRYPEKMDRFFEELFDTCGSRISVKTRIGWSDAAEWEDIAKVYGRYPFAEVIVHPRVREQFYNGIPVAEAIAVAMEYIKSPICYNGDIYSPEDEKKLLELYPGIDRIMIGRGMLRNPGLFGELKGEPAASDEAVAAFVDELLEGYRILFESDVNAMYHMKEIWFYLGNHYPEKQKALKEIKKARNLIQYRAAVRDVFR